jgi:hypothetical protein
MTTLAPQRRGDTFARTFTLSVGWTGAMFTGGMAFTLRRSVPASSVVSDADAVDQATAAGGEITFAGAGTSEDPCVATITIPASRTNSWPARELYFDVEGTVSGSPDVVHTLDSGTIPILADVTRGPVDS